MYLDGLAEADTADACQAGGRLTCVSELARWGVFVLERLELHVELPANARRRDIGRAVRRHWVRRRPDGHANADLVDALVLATQCQTIRAAIATLDSALHLGLIGDAELDEIFVRLPRRLRILRRHLDGSAESGAETMVRILVKRLGGRVESQVEVRGVGRVDFLVDGWLIIECDSRAHHSSWDQQRNDRRRDQAAAALGFATYRPIAEDVFWHPELVVAAVRGLLGSR